MTRLLTQDARRIPLSLDRPTADAVSEEIAAGSDPTLVAELAAIVGEEEVLDRAIDLVRYASDASHYRLVPQVVVRPRTPEQVGELLGYLARSGRHATFRAAGTSLSGQSQSDDVLIDVKAHFSGMVVEAGGARLRVRPGTILAHANAVLARHGRRLGPDPASAKVATVGGVLANNGAGMRCTPDRSAYATVSSLTFVLPSGTVIDTASPGAEAAFAKAEPELSAGLAELRSRVLADPELKKRIETKTSMRNTTGYSMRALLDGETPVEIFRRLLIGSEGTLAFIAEAVMETIEIPAMTVVGWAHLPSLDAAVAAVSSFRSLGAEAVELVPSSSLIRAAATQTAAPGEWAGLPTEGASLLLEFGAADADALEVLCSRAVRAAESAGAMTPLELSGEPAFVALSWGVRSRLNSELALARPAGSTNVAEDVCFPPDRLGEGVSELKSLLARYGYPEIVAGHAAYGNMHFSITPMLSEPDGRAKYGSFMEDFVELVVDRLGGSLKAEHGTGLNMAPFVTREWGEAAAEVMWKVKQLADPAGVLAPDVVLTRDEGVHLRRFKSDVSAHRLIDACIECGFCEAVCPSRHITTTPRQRIALYREMARQPPGSALTAALQRDYQYDAIETCAVDASCSAECPYGINTGALVKDFREHQATSPREQVALGVATSWGVVERGARGMISVVDWLQQRIGIAPSAAVLNGVRTVVSNDLVPTFPGPMPKAAARLPKTSDQEVAAVYFPACVNRIFGRDPDVKEGISLPQALVEVSRRAGRPLLIPDDVRGLCCGTIWSSKGYGKGRDAMAARMATAVLEWTRQGELPLVVDATSCTHGLIKDVPSHLKEDLRSRFEQVSIIDSVTWCRDLVPSLELRERLPRVTVHPGCSAARLGITSDFLDLASALAETVEQPYGSGCCGTAGDRGLLHPELVESATREERLGLPQDGPFLASNRTCEMGLRQATGKPYESIVLLLEEASRPTSG